MYWGISPLVLLLVSFVCGLTRADTGIDCDFGETCTLPCRFQAGDEVVIHWIQEEPVKAPAHSYYYKKDQLMLQDKRFQGRTSLFLDQLATGNASLRLTGVVVQDEGRYKCYTSTTAGHDQLFIQLRVNAPVIEVSVSRTGNGITCSSEGIYPEPKLTWSTEPPSDGSLQQNTTVRQLEKKLYAISSSLNLPSDGLNVSCTVQTHKNKKKTSLMKYSDQVSDNETNLFCTMPAKPRTHLVWRFNHSEDIVRQDSNQEAVVSDKWKKHFVELSESGSLKLKALTAEVGGLYTCEASNSEETLRSDTNLSLNQKETSPNSNTGVIVGAVLGVLLFTTISIGIYYWRRRIFSCCHSPHNRPNGVVRVGTEEGEHSITPAGMEM